MHNEMASCMTRLLNCSQSVGSKDQIKVSAVSLLFLWGMLEAPPTGEITDLTNS